MTSRIPYWAVYVGLVAVMYVLSLQIPSDAAVPALVRFTDPAKTSLDLVLEMVKLITALNTALLGAAAAIAVKGRDWSSRWDRVDGMLTVLTLVGVAVSYYGIYVGQVALLGTVSHGFIHVSETRLQWALTIQYGGTLVAVFLLGLLFVRMLENRLPSSQTPP